MIDNHDVRSTECLKLLGVCIDNNLRFDEHVSSISKKSAKRVGVLMRLRNLIPTQTKLQLYKAAVLPYLTYCHLIWHFCRASDSRRLERIQERALRAIYCDKHSSYGQLLSMARLSTLHNRRLQDIAILMYKVKNMCPTYINTLFEQPAIKYKLRNHDFTIPRYMGPKVVKVWSYAPNNVKKASTLSCFKYNMIRKVDLSMLLGDNNCSNWSLCIS